MRPSHRSIVLRIAVAVVSVLFASLVRTLVNVTIDETVPYTPFYPAIIVATMYGGLPSGVFATLLAGFAASFWLEPFGKPLIVELNDLAGLALFLIVSLVIVWLCERMRHAQQAAEQAVAEREILLAREQAARHDAEAANRLKDEFLASVSHELRTPLQGIVGWSDLLAGGMLHGNSVATAAATIHRNARIQSQLIEDLLDMSRIISGKMRLEIAWVCLSAVIDGAIETVKPAAIAKNITLEHRRAAAVPLVVGDASRLQQVVWNLLSNAIKFTPAGGRVTVTLTHQNDCVSVAVTDSGQGITADFLPHVFERFRQADSTTSRRQGGLGLGLAIVKSLVELHGGTVLAQSAGIGCGTTFQFSVPVTLQSYHRPQEVVTGGASGFSRPRSLAGTTILFVDDDDDTRQAVSRILTEYQADVITACSTREALELLRSMRPDILLSDLGMPEQDGFQLIREVRSIQGCSTERLPAIALTAYSSAEDKRRALDAGFQMHLKKPVDRYALYSALAAVRSPSVGPSALREASDY